MHHKPPSTQNTRSDVEHRGLLGGSALWSPGSLPHTPPCWGSSHGVGAFLRSPRGPTGPRDTFVTLSLHGWGPASQIHIFLLETSCPRLLLSLTGGKTGCQPAPRRRGLRHTPQARALQHQNAQHQGLSVILSEGVTLKPQSLTEDTAGETTLSPQPASSLCLPSVHFLTKVSHGFPL